MVNFAAIAKAVDAVIALRDAAKSFKHPPPPGEPEPGIRAPELRAVQSASMQLESRLTGVVVAALKEAFDRDHARLELERAQLDEERRRADAAMRMELHRQAADRELARLRLIGGAALVGWIASVLMVGAGIVGGATPARAALAVGWVLLLGALGTALAAQGRVAAFVPDGERMPDAGTAGAAALWLLIAGLAVAAIALLL